MRLSRLDLTRYGKFTDQQIDFGSVKKGCADLHIVYGPNEAGKSTALAAYLDVLFGIESRSAYAFIHPYASMEIGAALEIESALHEVVRLKRVRNSLVDLNGEPVAEDLFAGVLAGMDRQAYSTLYSLDDDTIEAGGESILANEGNLGELLYAASAGIADISQRLADMHAESNQFFRPRGGHELGELKKRLNDIAAQRAELDTLAQEHHRLVENRDAIQAEYDKTGTELGTVKNRIEQIQRMLRARPRLRELNEIRGELTPLQQLPDVPLKWSDQLSVLRDKGTELSVRSDTLAKELTSLKSDIAALPTDDAALAVAERISEFDPLRVRHNAAAEDLPERQAELARVNSDIQNTLRQLGKESSEEPVNLLLPVQTIGALESHIKLYSEVETAVQTSRRELTLAEQNLANAQDKLTHDHENTALPLDASIVDKSKVKLNHVHSESLTADAATLHGISLDELKAVVSEVRGSDITVRLAVAGKNLSKLQAEFETGLLKLQPWSGGAEQLSSLDAPALTEIQAWKADLEQARRARNERRQVWQSLESELREIETQSKAITSTVGVVSDQHAEEIRSQRDRAWSRHKQQLDSVSADEFEQLMFEVDSINSSRLTHSSDVARLNESLRSLALLRSREIRARELLAEAESDLQAINEQIATVGQKLNLHLPDEQPLLRLEQWLVTRETLLGQAAAISVGETEFSSLQIDVERYRNKLAEVVAPLISVASDSGLDTLLRTAQQVIDRESQLSSLRTLVAESQRVVEHRHNESLLAQQSQIAWNKEWESLCARCWFGQSEQTPAVETVQEIISHLAQLQITVSDQRRVQEELTKLDKYQTAYQAHIQSMASELGIVTDNSTANELDARIRRRVEQAVENQNKRLDKQQELKQKSGLEADLRAQLGINMRQTSEITTQLGVASIAEAEQQLQKIANREALSRRSQSVTQELLETLQVDSMTQAQDILESLDVDALNLELATLQSTASSLDERYRELYSSYVKAVDSIEAVGGDESVARLEEQRQTILLEIEDKALHYLKRKAGIIATESGLRVYRERHQSSMLAQASTVFSTISRGRYVRLATRPDKESDTLIGVTAEGGSKLSTEMSKGTRFQLYLALRVAGYFEYARTRTPVPFIADDIMETFDNERAEETIGVFADMAMTGQVIYLTHHRHLCELAEKVCPTVKVHNL